MGVTTYMNDNMKVIIRLLEFILEEIFPNSVGTDYLPFFINYSSFLWTTFSNLPDIIPIKKIFSIANQFEIVQHYLNIKIHILSLLGFVALAFILLDFHLILKCRNENYGSVTQEVAKLLICCDRGRKGKGGLMCSDGWNTHWLRQYWTEWIWLTRYFRLLCE